MVAAVNPYIVIATVADKDYLYGLFRIFKCLPEAIDGAWVIDSVATLPDH